MSENLSQLSWAERTKDTEEVWWTHDGERACRNRASDANQPYKAPHKMAAADAALVAFLAKQKKLLSSRKTVPASNRGTHKKQRARFVQTEEAQEARRAKVKQGKEAVDAALQSEWCTCPRGEKGKRRRRTACARDVAGWLWLRFRVKFCLKTVTADLREIQINSM